ncbi:hypothetical protein Zm00014a_002540 [Zea mays]|uniref:DUF8204 domain-containing protein n=1 Tax=Zea mays TaxID=4577 RepID=A0A3L6E3X1_MAIZE|nr:hypothetical protein Zm00014a_002540 [Zea mays]
MVEASPESGAAATGGASSTAAVRKGKSCKGCLYYSSVLKSRGYNPICVGIPRSIPQVPNYVVDEPKEEATAQGHDLRRFRYGCAGYSMFVDNRDGQGGESEGKTLLPYCRGLEVGYWWTADWSRESHRQLNKLQHMLQRMQQLPSALTNKDNRDLRTCRGRNSWTGKLLFISLSWSPAPTSIYCLADVYGRCRFKRSAGLVASGVAKNLNKTANYIKENIQDMYTDRRPPK